MARGLKYNTFKFLEDPGFFKLVREFQASQVLYGSGGCMSAKAPPEPGKDLHSQSGPNKHCILLKYIYIYIS